MAMAMAMAAKSNNNNKKEVFVIQHRKSNDKRPDPSDSGPARPDPNGGEIMAAVASGQVVRTSSCTKEEVDAILIQCGRLSRSSSGKLGNNNSNGGISNNNNGRKYCGSKRSFDFERESGEVINGGGDLSMVINDNSNISSNSNNSNGEEDERLRRRRQSRGSHRRRSTPSRSRERGERERSSGSREREKEREGVSRRVSRSPGKRRSESPIPISNPTNGNGNSSNGKPGKLVSVPPTVSSLSMEKGNNGNNGNNGGEVKRVLVKRNVGSPRSQSPARGNGNQGNGNGSSNQPSLSRNGSRKAEQSPYRRTPLNEIDMNSLPFQPLSNKRPMPKGKEIEEDGVVIVKQPISSASQNKHTETHNTKIGGAQGTHRRTRSRGAEGFEVTKTNYCRVNEVQTPNPENLTEPKSELMNPTGYDALVTPVIVSGCSDTLKLPQTLMRSRSSRRSRDFDINIDALTTPAPNPVSDYNSLLLQDIQNFHQKSNTSSSNNNTNTNVNNTPFSLPPCVTKACSILEAVADLNSSTDDKLRLSPREIDSKNGSNFPFVVESEVKVGDDLMEPSLHKYVTVRGKRGGDPDGEESSGSNSVIVGGGPHNWVSSSSWEPNSADSTDCWTSKSYSSTREDGFISPVGFQRNAISEFGCGNDERCERKLSKKEMEKFDHQQQIRGDRGRGPMQASSKATVASM